MQEPDDRIRATLDTVLADGWSQEDRDILLQALLVARNDPKTLNWMLNQAADRAACNQQILRAVKLVKGPHHTFSEHGFLKTIDGRFNADQKAGIARTLGSFSRYLQDRMGIQSFITSGTLLGLIRENRFLPHDDDFDMAYISNCTQPDDIVAERKHILEAINSSGAFRAEERTGGRAAIFVAGPPVKFNFDLFAGYRNGDWFNEFPLKPDTVKFADIAPVRPAVFYGEEVFVPRIPEALLEVNYGPGWKTPDPSFRFKFGEYQGYYAFLRKAAGAPAKTDAPT